MAAEALPIEPPPTPTLHGTGVALRREYRDILGRPLIGSVTVTGQVKTEAGELFVLPAAIAVELVDGVLDINLPPDTYHLTAALRTHDGARIDDSATVTVE